jgi:hypothetical protein
MPRKPEWDRVIEKLAPLPCTRWRLSGSRKLPADLSPSATAIIRQCSARSACCQGDGVDRETMRRTLSKALKEWRWDETWGWDYPLTAMTAARLGESKIAVDALLMETAKNHYLPNGHNYQRPNLPCYLPGNGGLACMPWR